MQLFNKYLIYALCLLFHGSVAIAKNEPLHPVKGTPQAAEFTLLDIDDKTHSLLKYRGRVVIVNFWATWCPPCRDELPSMERAWKIFKKHDVVLLGINVGEDADTIFEFTANYPVTFPLLLDLDSKVTKSYPVIGLPTSYVIDPEGRIIYQAIGTREWDAKVLIKKILALKIKN